MLTPVRKSLRLNANLPDAKDSAAEMLMTGQAVYVPDPTDLVSITYQLIPHSVL